MNATSVSKGTKYACNLKSKRGSNMLAMPKMVLESREYDFWTNLAKTNFRWLQIYLVPIERDCKHIRSPLWLWLQAFLVSFVTMIARIFGPCDKN